MRLFNVQLQRELKLLARAPVDVLNPLVFLFLAVALFALGLEADAETLSVRAAGLLWVLVLLTNMLSLDSMFRRDYEDGSLEQLVMQADPLFVPLLAKLLAQWLATGLLITLVSPLIGLLLHLPAAAMPALMWVLLVGTPAVSLLGAIGAALTVGLRGSGLLLGLLVLPLYVPVLIFGTSAVNAVIQEAASSAQIYWLAAISIMGLTFAPFAVQASLRISLER